MEFVDVATGEPVDPAPKTRPESDGTAPTGRVVADFDGVDVEVDDEDILDSDGVHPRERSYRFDVEGPDPDYPTQARQRAEEQRAEAATAAKKPKLFRETFDSAGQAASEFYDGNELFFDNVHDPVDGLREWADGIDVRTGKASTRRLVNTAVGRKILEEGQGAPQIRAALRWVFNQAAGRRWDAVPWQEVDRLGAALQPLYEPPSAYEAGTPGLYWRPIVGAVTREQLGELDSEDREQLADWESAEELNLALADLREAYARNLDCLSPVTRAIVERRIAAWNRWARDSSKIPDYACEPDAATGGYTCNYPSVTGELRELQEACEHSYDPDWAEPEGRAAAPGFPDLSAGPDDPYVGEPADAPLEDLVEAPTEVEQYVDESGAGVSAEPDIVPEPDDPFRFPGEMVAMSEPVAAPAVQGLRQLADDGRAYGASRPAVVEAREHDGVLYQREYRKCGKRNPKTGRPWCWCHGAWPENGHGPYWYAYWRDETTGRRRSAYVGKAFQLL